MADCGVSGRALKKGKDPFLRKCRVSYCKLWRMPYSIYKVSVRAYEWRRRKREHGALEGVKPRRFIEKGGFGGARAGQARRAAVSAVLPVSSPSEQGDR